MVGVDRHVRVVQVNHQPLAPIPGVRQCPEKRIARQQPLRLELSINPMEEFLNHGLGLRLAHRALGFSRELLLTNGGLNRI